jgi:hypothetical protein
VCRLISKLIHFLWVKRPESLRREASQLPPVSEDQNDSKDKQDKLGKELETLDTVLLRSPLLDPWADDQHTKNPDEPVYGKEYEKAKEDVIEGLHY